MRAFELMRDLIAATQEAGDDGHWDPAVTFVVTESASPSVIWYDERLIVFVPK